MEKLIDAHYFILPTQGNIYSLAILNLSSGFNKILVASLKKKIFSFEYNEINGVLKPFVKEISCTYIPSGAEIISVDAFNKSNIYDDFQIGIAIAKLNAEGSPETYLNIYSDQDLGNNSSLNIDNIAQNCLMVELNFIPYHLTHTLMPGKSVVSGSNENLTVWLLSGSDGKVHVFEENAHNHTYMEVDSAALFPELANPPSIPMWMDIYHCSKLSKRVTAVGCECGSVQLSVVNIQSNSVISTYCDVFDGPISKVLLFSITPQVNADIVECLNKRGENEEALSPNVSKTDLHLLVCSTLQASVVYMNVIDGLSEKHSLKGSDLYEACLCGCVADINFDGYNEIILGTYGQEILMYQWNKEEWLLQSQRSVANPVHSLAYLDLTGEGVCQLVVHTLSGVNTLQHDPKEVCQILLERLRKLHSVEENRLDPS